MKTPHRVILASSSAYRRQLLARLGLTFETESPNVDESAQPGETAAELARRLAELKARTVASATPGAVVIGSDQVAECHGRLLGKPGSEARALEQLRGMQGAEVVFQTAVAVVHATECHSAVVPTRVRMRQLTDDQLRRYLHREAPFDCAGAFKSEALGIALLDSVRSEDPTALVGLPLIATIRLLEQCRVRVL